MGTVAVSIKVMPESPETDMEHVRQEIAKLVKVQDSKIEPIAFGLKALRILITTPDTGGTEAVEKKIKSIKGVADVEVESVTLL